MNAATPPHEGCSGLLSGSRVRVAAQSVSVGSPAPVAEPIDDTAPGLQIRLIRDGEVIRAIEVTCTCGERIVLDCLY